MNLSTKVVDTLAVIKGNEFGAVIFKILEFGQDTEIQAHFIPCRKGPMIPIDPPVAENIQELRDIYRATAWNYTEFSNYQEAIFYARETAAENPQSCDNCPAPENMTVCEERK